MEVTTYLVTTQRSGGWWAFSARDVPGVFGQARRLDQVTQEARDVISLMTGEPEDSFDIKLEPHLDPTLEHEIRAARSAREKLEQVQALTADAIRKTAADMSSRGLSVRDIGSLLGLSYQRVSQVLGKAGVSQRRKTRR